MQTPRPRRRTIPPPLLPYLYRLHIKNKVTIPMIDDLLIFSPGREEQNQIPSEREEIQIFSALTLPPHVVELPAAFASSTQKGRKHESTA